MTALLTDNLPLLAGAPNGIKKLRELILELAVRGKLVPQDPNDEPASELLKRIAEEKARLVAEGKIKKQKGLAEIGETERPFDAPPGWEWVSLNSISELENGDRSSNYPNKSQLVEKGIAFINAGHLVNGRVDMADMNYISRERFDLLRSGKVADGDILFCLRGSLGKNALVKSIKEGAIASSLVIIRVFPKTQNNYLMRYLSSSLASRMIKKYDNGTAQPNLSAGDLGKFLLPIPPLTEQHRIVAKVDELMTLCDRLEARQTDADSAHAQLVQALLDSLVQARDAEDFAQSWQRLAEHFHTLFTTESSIDALKQTLLQLAVMGKLVPQDPNDEPASELLKQLSNESANEVIAKKKKPLPASMKEQNLFVPPKSWAWCRVGDLISIKHGYAFSSDFFCNSRSPYILTTPGNFFECGGFKDRGDRTKYYDGPVDQEFILEPGDLIVAMTEQASGLLGSVAIIPSDENIYLHNQRLGKLIFNREILCSGFVSLYFNSAFLRSSVAESSTGMKVKHTSPIKIEAIKFPLPPLAEQHRIVAKVDQLMTLCDQLKARLNQARQVHEQLASALVEQAVA